MAAALTHLQASDPHGVVEALREHGGVIVEGVLSRSTLARFNAELDPLLEHVNPARSFLNPALEFFFGTRTRHLTATHPVAHLRRGRARPSDTVAVCDRLSRRPARYRSTSRTSRSAPARSSSTSTATSSCGVRAAFLAAVAAVVAPMNFGGQWRLCASFPAAMLDADRSPTDDDTPSPRCRRDRRSRISARRCTAAVRTRPSINGGAACTSAMLGWLRTEENHYLATPPDIAHLPRRPGTARYAAHDAPRRAAVIRRARPRDPVDMLADGSL
jgi:hypothetical protein